MRSNQRDARRWNPSPWRVRAVKAAMFGVPVAAVIAVSVVFANLSSRPSTMGPQALWWLGLTACATGAAFVSRPVVQRLAPLHFVYQLNLAFPEHAPQRFGTAIRRSGVRELERRLALGGSIGDTPQQAAEHMIALLARLTHHDRLTRGHCERVAAYTSMIADELAMSDAEKDQLRWAALIHDVGKLNVAAALLNKTTPPSAGDWRELRRHPAAARQFVGPLRPWLGNAVLAASQHHEHWNGRLSRGPTDGPDFDGRPHRGSCRRV
jgi:hypothetical protein